MSAPISERFAGWRLRAGPLFRAFIYSVLAFWVLSGNGLAGSVLQGAADALDLHDLSPASVSFGEAVNLATALVLTGLFAWCERRSIGDYGLPAKRPGAVRFWEGFAIGVVNAGAVMLGMILLGGMTIHGLALHGTAILWGTLAWFCANILVGLGEELLFRGYLLQTLWKGVGFWPASVLIALWFAADHYLFKQGENLWDVITLVSISLWLCYSVLKTGTLWLAVGYHVAFDFMQLFVIGTRNGGVVPTPLLLNASFQGPAWINGGVLGTEASIFMYPLLAAMFFYLWWRFGPGAGGSAGMRTQSVRISAPRIARNDVVAAKGD